MQPSEALPEPPPAPPEIPVSANGDSGADVARVPEGSSPELEKRYAELRAKAQAARPTDDVSALDKAWRLAVSAHKTQKRASGEPYVGHPLEVAHILADMQTDLACVITGLLHDTVEDTGVNLEGVKAE